MREPENESEAEDVPPRAHIRNQPNHAVELAERIIEQIRAKRERMRAERERDAKFERVMADYERLKAEHEHVRTENERIRAENDAECERIRKASRERIWAACECPYMAILGLVAGYTARELKIAYKRASLRTHPDKGGSDAAFRATNEAYEYLKA